MFVFDIESDGLLDTISKLHCINAFDRATGRGYRFTDHEFYQDVEGNYTDERTPRDGTIKDALEMLASHDHIAGHNIHGYDCPAIELALERGYLPGVDSIVWKDGQKWSDSRTTGEFLFPDLKNSDWALIRKGKLPESFGKGSGKHGTHAGSHSLAAWGLRLAALGYDVNTKTHFDPKDYGHTWATMPFTKEMDDYCYDDVLANVALFEYFESRPEYVADAVELEQEVSRILRTQELHGIRFDEEAAEKLAAELYIEQARLREECQNVFPPFYKKGKEFTPKRPNKKMGYVAGATVTKVEHTLFNPGSNQHVERCLRQKYGWEPTEFTDTGLAKIDEEILGTLPFAEAKKIAEFRTVNKRLSQLCEGKQAWMKKVKKDGRIYGRVNQNGTITFRMSHFGPNLAQVPANHKPWGRRCRELFVADLLRVIVGCDADALELRVLAHFLARYDNGAYIEVVLNGSKEDGTDMHTRNQLAVGLRLRDSAKTFFYALLYGSGDYNLGTIVLADWEEEKLRRFYAAYPPGQRRRSKIVAIGKRGRDKLFEGLPALGKLVDAVQSKAKQGWIQGLDGRKLICRSQHAALNTLCQSAGAIIMKRALVIMFNAFKQKGLDVIPLLNVHDEVQLSAIEEEAQDVGRLAADAIRAAGDYYGFRCPLAGDYDVGTNWSQTH